MNRDIVQRYFRDPPQITTPRLILRKLKKSDYRDMYEYACDPAVTEYLTWQPHANPMWTMRYLAYVATRYRTGEFFDHTGGFFHVFAQFCTKNFEVGFAAAVNQF